MNNKIEQFGLEKTTDYFSKLGYNVSRAAKGSGYDLLVTDNTSSFFVEVKATEKPKFNQRWLEKKEWNCLQSNPNNYLITLVTKAFTDQFELNVYDAKQLMDCFHTEETKYVFNLKDIK